jgi:hypothetical protein
MEPLNGYGLISKNGTKEPPETRSGTRLQRVGG